MKLVFCIEIGVSKSFDINFDETRLAAVLFSLR